MIAREKREWFEMDKPIGEPPLADKYNADSYWIERVVDINGDIIWYGQGTNWVSKDNGKTWKYLGVDETIEMIPETKNERGEWVGGYYPEGRSIWIDCETPIYEKMYKEI